MGIVDNNRPPYVVWETRAVEDRSQEIEKGHYGTRDVDFAIITRPGDRDTLDKEAKVWLSELREKARSGTIPDLWYNAFQDSYDRWKKGEEVPETGTPIKTWPLIGPSARADILRAGIRTVEDLAALSDSDLRQLGMGAVSLKLKAQNFLAASEGPGKLAAQTAAQAQQIEELAKVVKAQAEELDKLRKLVPAQKA